MNNNTIKALDTIIRITICLPATIILFPFFAVGCIFKDDMATIKEFLTAWKNKETTVLYEYWRELEEE